MNIDRFKHEHEDILAQIDALRAFSQAGPAGHATQIAQGIVAISSTIRLHLAVEDRMLYPALQAGSDAELARLGLADAAARDDIGDLRQLLGAWRDAKTSAWKAAVDWAACGLLALLLVGLAMKLGLPGLLR